ncbi:MAG: hypothetical protein AAF004_07670 [Pseudomonadota bacterium]
MTTGFAIALLLAGVTATLLIHLLYRGARKQLIVANPDLYTDEAAPRLVLQRITQIPLLLLRCAFVLAVFATALSVFGALPIRTGPIVTHAIVPGTPTTRWQSLAESDNTVVWLDRALTRIDRAPVSEFSAASLRKLDAQLPTSAPLTVVGALPARDWPRRGFAMTREVTWVPTAATSESEAHSETAVRPPVVIAVDAPALRAELEFIAALWRAADVVSNVQFQSHETLSVAPEAWLILVGDDATAPLRERQSVTLSLSMASLTALLEMDTTGARATRLWQQLSALPAALPAREAVVTGSPFVRVPEIQQRLSSVTDPNRLSWWMFALAGLFVAERLLSAAQRSVR